MASQPDFGCHNQIVLVAACTAISIPFQTTSHQPTGKIPFAEQRPHIHMYVYASNSFSSAPRQETVTHRRGQYHHTNSSEDCNRNTNLSNNICLNPFFRLYHPEEKQAMHCQCCLRAHLIQARTHPRTHQGQAYPQKGANRM